MDGARSLELRQAVVFAARFEWATQRYALIQNGQEPRYYEGREAIPEGELTRVVPVPNPARVREYWADVMPPGTREWDFPKHWCGALCLFAIRRAGIGDQLFCKIGDGFEGELEQLAPGAVPEPGDVAYFHRYAHRCIVESVDAERKLFNSIDGNQSPGIVRYQGRKLSAAAAFYSLRPLLEQMEAQHGAA